MITKTIVHAGFHKTGTTTLQQGLAATRTWLDQHGLVYPVEHCGVMPAQHELACKLCSPRGSGGPNDLFLPEREAFADAIGARVGAPANVPPSACSMHACRLISSEIFSTFDESEIRGLAAAVEPIDRFILYVRNGISFIYSCWAAKVSWGHQGEFDEFLRASLDFEPATPIVGPLLYVEMLIELFGSNRVQSEISTLRWGIRASSSGTSSSRSSGCPSARASRRHSSRTPLRPE